MSTDANDTCDSVSPGHATYPQDDHALPECAHPDLRVDEHSAFANIDDVFDHATTTVDDNTMNNAIAGARGDFTASMRCGEWLGVHGRLDAARDAFEHARDLARQEHDLDRVAVATDRLASALWDAGRMNDAEGHLRDVMNIADSMGDDTMLTTARWRLGVLLAARDDADVSEEAIELLSRARSSAQANGDAHLAAECDDAAAAALRARGDHPAAIAALHRAISVMEAAGSLDIVARLRANLATSLIATGSARDAEAALLAARDNARDGHRRGLTSIVTRLAVVWCSMGKADEALAELDVVDPTDMPTNRAERARFHLARAQAYNHLGLRAGAREAALDAIDSLRGAMLPVEHALALEHLGECASIEDATDYSDPMGSGTSNSEGGRLFLGEALALYVIAGRDDDARRVAARIAPRPPQDSQDESIHDDTPTGLYL